MANVLKTIQKTLKELTNEQWFIIALVLIILYLLGRENFTHPSLRSSVGAIPAER